MLVYFRVSTLASPMGVELKGDQIALGHVPEDPAGVSVNGASPAEQRKSLLAPCPSGLKTTRLRPVVPALEGFSRAGGEGLVRAGQSCWLPMPQQEMPSRLVPAASGLSSR